MGNDIYLSRKGHFIIKLVETKIAFDKRVTLVINIDVLKRNSA
jgi:hypothetical protein